MSADDFRWQAFFRRSHDALFVLDRVRRVRWVNRAWEALTGLSAVEARNLYCTQRRPAVPGPVAAVLAHVLCPPPEVHHGQPSRARRLFPGEPAGRQWWDVEFFPLRGERGLLGVIGRVTVAAAPETPATAALSEKLLGLRERRRCGFAQLASHLPGMRQVVEQARLAAQTRVPVLLVGEPGSGKHWLARTIHDQGPNREQTFVALDCGGLPPEALAAVLFGDGTLGRGVPAGTVYLADAAALPRDLQERVCAWLQEPTAPRIIAACGPDPAADVGAGRLLEELYCALGTLTIALPPLRDRLADLPDLVQALLARANEGGEAQVVGLTKEALDLVHAYRWPGNLRELDEALRSARRHVRGERIDVAHLPAPLRLAVRLQQTPDAAPEPPLPLDKLLEDAERRLILLALRRARGNRSKAAEILAIWRPRLLRRMEALGITEPEP
jgi:DNA-binding NtrC family response regulator